MKTNFTVILNNFIMITVTIMLKDTNCNLIGGGSSRALFYTIMIIVNDLC